MPGRVALWSSGFRPFFLLGVAYGIALMLAWALALAAPGAAPWPAFVERTWHAHEMLFGFAGAIIAGVVLAGLPGWSGTGDVRDGTLALLVAFWIAGRAGVWLASSTTLATAALADLLFVPALLALLTAQLLRVPDKRYRLLLPVLAGLFAAQLFSHRLIDTATAHVALCAAVYAIVVLYALVGGLLTPVFTGNVLRETGRGNQAPFVPALEAGAAALVVVLAVLDLADAPAGWIGSAALACTIVHGWRVARWKGWHAAGSPIELAMNLGFAWLIAAFALRAAAAFGAPIPVYAWVHAFTVGSLGMMMIGLMTRVVLRHTGRPLAVPRAILVAGGAMFAAALLRLAASVHALGNATVALAALLWAIAFSIWFVRYAPMLLAPSLARRPVAGRGPNGANG